MKAKHWLLLGGSLGGRKDIKAIYERSYVDNNSQIWPDAKLDSSHFGTFTRASVAWTSDHENAPRKVGNNVPAIHGLRLAQNMASGNATQNITVESGRIYQVSIGADSDSGATVDCATAFTGTLTAGDSP
jgi:hypothetical protein